MFLHLFNKCFREVLTTEDRPSSDGEEAWKAIQAKFRQEEEKVRKAHGKVKDVRERRMSLVHSALASGQRFIPTEGLSGAAADRVMP